MMSIHLNTYICTTEIHISVNDCLYYLNFDMIITERLNIIAKSNRQKYCVPLSMSYNFCIKHFFVSLKIVVFLAFLSVIWVFRVKLDNYIVLYYIYTMCPIVQFISKYVEKR